MHRTPSGDRRQSFQKEAHELARDARALQKAARAHAARLEAQRLQGEANAAIAEAEALRLLARREALNVWEMEKSSRAERAPRPTPTGWPPGARAARRAMCIWGAAGRWMLRKPARRPGRGRRRRWATMRPAIDDRAWPGAKAGRCDASAL